MSILIAIAILILVVVFGLIVVIGGHLGAVQTCTINTRELPNVAADIGTPGINSPDLNASDLNSSGRDRARR